MKKKKIKYKEFLDLVEEKTGKRPTHTEISETLDGDPTANSLGNRLYNNGTLSNAEYKVLSQFYLNETAQDKFEIKYWKDAYKYGNKFINPFVRSKWGDKEMALTQWKKEPENICIIAMPGDRMNGGERAFKNKDVLCVDVSENTVAGGGYYLITTNSGADAFVCAISKRFDGAYRVFFTNPLYSADEYTVTKEEAQKRGVKIVGRIFHNYNDIF